MARRIASAVSLLYLLWLWWSLLPDQGGIHAIDSRTYWSTSLEDPYQGPQVGLPGAYLYSPAFLQAITPLRLLPWEAFHGLWLAAGIAAAIYMVGPIGAALALGLLPFVFRDLYIGNIHLMLGALMVIGMRHSAAWAAVILTKVTPGIGVTWFAARGEWRPFAIGVGVTAIIAAASFAVAPQLWFAWADRLTGDTGTAGTDYMLLLVVRCLAGLGLVVLGARTNRAWLVPIAATIAVPILWPDSLAMLLATIPLVRWKPSLVMPASAAGQSSATGVAVSR